MKCSILIGYQTGVICFLIFKNLYTVLGGAKDWAQIWDFQKVFKIDIWQRF